MTASLRLLVMVIGLFGVLAAPVSAASLRWTFDNETNTNISIEFYSQDRNHVWPGNGDVYVVKPRDGRVNLTLNCRQNELICYGGWIRGNTRTYWGSGHNDSQRCSNCCARCGKGNVEAIDLIR